MAGTTLAYPINGASNWEDFVSIVQRMQLGFMRVSMSEIDVASTDEPQILAGSSFDLNSVPAVFGSDESPSGYSGLAASSVFWIKAVESSGAVTLEYTATPPSWSASKMGWYDGNDRYIGGGYRGPDPFNYCTYKWLYPESPSDPIMQEMFRSGNTRPVLYVKYDIGDWDMSSFDNVSVTITRLDSSRVISLDVIILSDNGTAYPLMMHYASEVQPGGGVQISDTSVFLNRVPTGGGITSPFQNANFDATSYNRGYINLELRG